MAAEWARGWLSSDKLICLHCIGDDYLRDVVARAATEDEECSFCGRAPAAEFDVFMEAFMVGVHNRFEQADDAGMPWEGGYVFETFEQYELPDRFRVDVQERENRIEVALKIVTHAGTSLAARVSPQAGRIRHHHYRQGSGHSAKASAA